MKKSVKLQQITDYLDNRLEIKAFMRDSSNNGLQVEASGVVSKIVCGVDGCRELFIKAAEANADLVIVHHGLSWGGEPRRLTGIDSERFGTLFRKNINLYACHLPLDAHPEIGNNAILCSKLPLKERESFFSYCSYNIGYCGSLEQAVKPESIAEIFNIPDAKLFGAVNSLVKKIAVVSGGAGLEAVAEAAERGCNMLITGEMEHVMYHAAIESNITVLALGHYESETVGVRAITAEVAAKFDLPHEFIYIPTGL